MEEAANLWADGIVIHGRMGGMQVKIDSAIRDDARLRALPDKIFRVWFYLACVAAENGGLVDVRDTELLAVEVAGGDVELLQRALARLEKLHLIEPAGDGMVRLAQDRKRRTRPSDAPEAVRERVRRCRERKKAGQQPEQQSEQAQSINLAQQPEPEKQPEKEKGKIIHISQPTNSQLIAELGDKYREAVPGEKWQNGDYAFIGRLYNEYGYKAVLEGINSLAYKVTTGFVPDNCLIYLRGIVRRGIENGPQQRPAAAAGGAGNRGMPRGFALLQEWAENG